MFRGGWGDPAPAAASLHLWLCPSGTWCHPPPAASFPKALPSASRDTLWAGPPPTPANHCVISPNVNGPRAGDGSPHFIGEESEVPGVRTLPARRRRGWGACGWFRMPRPPPRTSNSTLSSLGLPPPVICSWCFYICRVEGHPGGLGSPWSWPFTASTAPCAAELLVPLCLWL